METESERLYYSVSEAAELVGVSEQVIEGWISRSMLRGYRKGGSVVISRAELDAYKPLADAAKGLEPLPGVDEVIAEIRAGRRRFVWPTEAGELPRQADE